LPEVFAKVFAEVFAKVFAEVLTDIILYESYRFSYKSILLIPGQSPGIPKGKGS
jgi:hypothetical protein